LIEWGIAWTWQDVFEIAKRLEALRVYIDSAYAERQAEVYEACLAFQGFVAIVGKEIKDHPFIVSSINPFEGKRKQTDGESIPLILFNSTTIKNMTFDLMGGKGKRKWYVYKGIEMEYVKQVTSETKIAGRWKLKNANADNHLWDCECYQSLVALQNGFFS